MRQGKRNEKLERIVKLLLVGVVAGCGFKVVFIGETAETRRVKTIKEFKETRDFGKIGEIKR